MKKYNQIERKRLFLSMITHPIFVFVYCISFYELYTLFRFGKMNNNIFILVICMLFFIVWFIILIFRIMKRKATVPEDVVCNSSYRVIWNYIAVAIIIISTLFYGIKIYESGINLNGKLSWFLKDLKDKKTVEFQHNNIYEDGIEGIFTDINKDIPMVEKLYVSNNFDLKFNSDGEITSFDTYLYGKNDKDEVESYLISYDSSRSKKITVYLRGYVNADYNEDKLFEPLIETMKVIHLKDTVNTWDEKQYGILYYGKRNWGYNAEGIVYVDTKGNIMFNSSASSEIVGYTVSVYVPGKENIYSPIRYNLVEDLNNIKASDAPKDDKKSNNGIDEFYISNEVGYRLEVTGAAAGSRSYSLNHTSDGGITWETINEDPFLGKTGVAAGITFLNDKLGFICLSHGGGSNGELYRTEDGGLSYKKVNFPEVKVTVSGLEPYNPFDLPTMPYEQEGILNILIGQGADGDYNGGCKALYQSKDQGITWNYIKEVN